MGTRTGDIDPSIVTFLQEKEGWTAAQTNSFLNKKCGLLGLYGKSSDCRDIENAVLEGDKGRSWHNIFAYRVLKYIGSYTAAMNGADLIVFTGGIGENDFMVREIVGTRLGFLGVTFDSAKKKKCEAKMPFFPPTAPTAGCRDQHGRRTGDRYRHIEFNELKDMKTFQEIFEQLRSQKKKRLIAAWGVDDHTSMPFTRLSSWGSWTERWWVIRPDRGCLS
jgi:hypothetical protein